MGQFLDPALLLLLEPATQPRPMPFIRMAEFGLDFLGRTTLLSPVKQNNTGLTRSRLSVA